MSDWRVLAQTGAAAAIEVRECPDGEVEWRVWSSSGVHVWGRGEAPSLAIAFELGQAVAHVANRVESELDGTEDANDA